MASAKKERKTKDISTAAALTRLSHALAHRIGGLFRSGIEPVEVGRKARKFLLSLSDKRLRDGLQDAIGGLASNPRPPGCLYCLDANTDWTKARTAYDSVSQQISAAARTAGQKSGPALRWIQDQARDLGSQIQQHVPATR